MVLGFGFCGSVVMGKWVIHKPHLQPTVKPEFINSHHTTDQSQPCGDSWKAGRHRFLSHLPPALSRPPPVH